MSVVTKRVRSVPFEAVVTLCVCHITAKKPSNISVQPHGRRKDKLSGLQSLSALLQRLLSCLWAFSGLLRLTREFPGFIAHGSVRENNFPDKKKKKKRFLQSGLGNFTQDLCFKVFVGLPGKGREWTRSRQIPCHRAGTLLGGSRPQNPFLNRTGAATPCSCSF